MADPNSATTLISTQAKLKTFLSSIPPSSTIYVDLEGKDLSRKGTISLITILVHPQGLMRIIDVLSLEAAAFTTTPDDGRSLKSIFEDGDVRKCFWDVRNSADALWALHQVGLAGVTDVQLLQNACRTGDKTYLSGLDKSIQSDLKLGFMELERWIRTKRDINRLMTSDIFSVRPVAAKTIQYCTNDVIHLPSLQALYSGLLSDDWPKKVKEESMRRVEKAHAPEYEPQGPNKLLGPWGMMTGRRGFLLDDMFDEFEDQLRDPLEDDDEVGYWDEWDKYPENSHRADFGDGAFDSYGCRSG